MRQVSPRQLSLFGDDAPAEAGPECPLDLGAVPGIERDRELAARLPEGVYLGTSTWTYPGWVGVVYPDKPRPTERWIKDHGLRTFSSHPLLRTFGMDQAYYRPFGEADWRRYAGQLPEGYRCVIKAWSAITTRVDHRSHQPCASYLDAGLFCDRVLSPIARQFQEHAGPIVLEFAPVPRSSLPSPSQYADELHRFFEQLPGDFSYAVELRNRELLTPEHLGVLRHHGVGHVLNLWERMPSIGEQLRVPGIFTAPFVVSRLMLRPGTRYEQMKRAYAPFDRIVDADESARRDVAALAHECLLAARPLYVIAGNKVEGCGPLTARAIAERIVETRPMPAFSPKKAAGPSAPPAAAAKAAS